MKRVSPATDKTDKTPYIMGYTHAIDNYINLLAYNNSTEYKAGYDHAVSDINKIEEYDYDEQF